MGRFDWLSPDGLKRKSPCVNVTVRQLTAEMSYDYEYLGRYQRLVVTPGTLRVQYRLEFPFGNTGP